MRELALSEAVPSNDRDDDVLYLFKAKLSWGQSWALRLFTIVMCGKEHPIEKDRDVEARPRSCIQHNQMPSV